jgi:glycosyltransferase involved in cell wall biosynthesis
VNRTKPRILLIKPVLPYPPDQGTKVVSFDLIRALGREFDVTVLARVLDRQSRNLAEELEKHCEKVVTVFPAHKRSLVHRVAYRAWYQARSLLGKRSLKSLYDCPAELVDAAARLAGQEYDLFIVEYWQLYPLFTVLPAERTVLLTHDIDQVVNRQDSLLEKRLFHKVRKVRRWLRERREETFAYRQARRVLALTERDADSVRRIAPGAEVFVLPVGFDGARLGRTAVARRESQVLFMGAMSAGFNRDALEYFVTRVYPHLEDDASIEIRIVGGELPKHLLSFGEKEQVEVVGWVSDVTPYLHEATCLVVPMRYGGGLRIRILEAMFAGLPVVCTPVAIAGMNFEAGEHYLLGETAEGLAGQIKALLGDPVGADALRQAALKAVRERYSTESQAAKTVDLFRRFL